MLRKLNPNPIFNLKPPQATLPRAPGPAESWQDVQVADLASKIDTTGRRAIYADGASCWRKLAKEIRIPVFEAAHQRKDFRTLDRKPKGLSKQTGTQVIDNQWQPLKKKRLKHGINPEIRKICFQWCWRSNAKADTPHAFLAALRPLTRK